MGDCVIAMQIIQTRTGQKLIALRDDHAWYTVDVDVVDIYV